MSNSIIVPVPYSNGDLRSWRNDVARVVCNWIMRHIATPTYRAHIEVFVRAGMEDVYGGRLYEKYAPEES